MPIRVYSESDTQALKLVVERYANGVQGDMDDAVRKLVGDMRDDIINNWPIDTGASRTGWQGPTKVGEAHYQLSNAYDYAPTIEYGGYPGVGPKTEQMGGMMLPGGIQMNGGIYPTQKPAAPMRRALSKAKMKLTHMMASAFMRKSGFRGLGGGGMSRAFRG